ncbi:MAG: aminopeptidase [Deltaproteobacteria bacterium]|nr:aminopeptidase [Deltaproteobacteria bacterium]
MPDRQEILKGTDPSLVPAGRMALEVCLAVTPQDVVTFVADEGCLPVIASMLQAAENLGLQNRAFLLERWGKRPLGKFPGEIVAAFETSQVTVLAVAPLAGELKARLQLLELVPRRQLRHAHLIRVGAEAFRVGMRADYRAVDGLQERLLAVLPTAARVHVTSPGGTSLDVTFDPHHRWVKSNGLIRPGKWQNLPSGQVYTCPATVDGTYVVDKTIGDWFASKYPDLSEFPVTLEFAAGRLRDVRSDNATLARELFLFVRSNENGDRVGEFGVGTNPWLHFISGEHTFDENVPGVHLALGDPFGHETGATWTSKTRVSVIGTRMSMEADGRLLMDQGVYVPEILGDVRVPAPEPGAVG